MAVFVVHLLDVNILLIILKSEMTRLILESFQVDEAEDQHAPRHRAGARLRVLPGQPHHWLGCSSRVQVRSQSQSGIRQLMSDPPLVVFVLTLGEAAISPTV